MTAMHPSASEPGHNAHTRAAVARIEAARRSAAAARPSATKLSRGTYALGVVALCLAALAVFAQLQAAVAAHHSSDSDSDEDAREDEAVARHHYAMAVMADRTRQTPYQLRQLVWEGHDRPM